MVERIRKFLTQFQAQSQQFYGGLSRGRRIGLLVGAGAILVLLVSMLSWQPTVKYEVAYSNLGQEDQTKILKFLKSKNINNFKLDGDSLAIPEEQLLDIKMQLAQEGLPNSGVGIGWEKFDERAFGMTDFDQRVNKMRAIQGEISRTINRLEPVESSRVHIVQPEATVFAEDKRPATSSIYLKLKSGKTLSSRQVQGILHLAAKAVEGLDPKNIAIVDQDGNILTMPDEEDGGLDKVTNTQREFEKRVARDLESKIREILGRVVGHDKVVAKVQADIEFKKVETTIQDVDPERAAVVSSQRAEQSSAGSGLNPTGVPGVKSNLPGEKEDTQAGGSQSNSKQNSETLNFEVKKTLSKIVEPVGTVKKLSAAVLVDGKMIDGKFTDRSAEEKEKITKLVKNAIGFQDGRDSITVETAQFEMDAFAVAEAAALTARKTSLLQTGIFSTVAIAAMIFLYFAVVRPYFRWLTFDPEKRSREEFAVMDYELERSSSAAKRVQVQEEVPFEKLSTKEQILYLAKHDPKKTTEAIRQFLSPNHS